MSAREWDLRYARDARVRAWADTPNRFLLAEVSDLPAGRALDVACGMGRNAIWLAERGWTVTALDFSQVAVDRGRRVAGELPVIWRVDDALTVELPRSDLVVLAYLQLAAEQRRTVVRRALAALEPGGTFLLVAHDSTNLAEGTGGPQDPSVLYTAEDVLTDLEGEPFEVMKASRVARVVTQGDEHGGTERATAWDALVRLVRR